MTREFSRAQIGRFAMLDRYPKTEIAALSDLVDALLTGPPDPDGYVPVKNELSPSEVFAKGVVDSFLDTATSETRCPMSSEIRSAIHSRQDDFRPNENCPMCKGSGDIYFPRTNSSKRCDVPGCWARRPAPVYPKGKPFDVSGAVSKVRVQ